jgi:hypothetical protein
MQMKGEVIMNKAETKQNKPTLEQIAALAYDIWQKGGCKPGTDLENWLDAEKQLNHCAVTAAAQKESAKTNQKARDEATQRVTSRSGNSETDHLRRATNVRLQQHLART